MSWDYNYNFANIQVQAPFDKNQVELSAQLSDVQKTSFSSASSESTASSAHRRSMATDYVTDSEMESKLLPQNLWGDSKSLASATAHTAAVANRANTIEEQRFLQSQLSGPDLWYSSDYTQPTVSAHDVGSSASSVFDMKMNSHPHPPRTQVSTPASSNTPNSLSHYGLSGMSSFQGIVSPATASSPLQIESLNAKKLESDKLPLTEENLTKLQQSPTEKNAQANNNQNNTQNNNNNNNNTTTQAKSSHSSENKSTVNTELYKTELCTTFLKSGSCPYGNKCQFAHGENELKVVERGSKWRSKPCANWTKTGSCRYGNRCCFKHE
ncbi:mRNA decay factor CTH1 [Cyberlindnera fabianii]|uniref:mRNA decay factor CTH1 n=1 Tax=Cyberlindnera fabianii TaxID=36022 RepID=A0A1V2L1E5_CYBFA|nr:mRNA decay factor CTH1 [Cyberlindnera fabianii]